jgi:hypothetical protein
MKALKIILLAAFALPVAYIAYFFVPQFPFTSGVIAHAFAPTGEEICVVQTYKGVEPYQISLYARRPGQPWAWSYLAHQDDRWRGCRIEIAGDILRVYRGSTLNRTFSLARATDATAEAAYAVLPSEYSTQQILAHHNTSFR